MVELCTPAIMYIVFSVIQIIIDIYNGFFNTAVLKVVIAIMMTFFLNVLCNAGMTWLSWIIVFIPFILMAVAVAILLYAFGLDAARGKDKDNKHKDKDNKHKKQPNNLIYSSEKTRLNADSNLIYSSNNNAPRYMDTSYSDGPLTYEYNEDV